MVKPLGYRQYDSRAQPIDSRTLEEHRRILVFRSFLNLNNFECDQLHWALQRCDSVLDNVSFTQVYLNYVCSAVRTIRMYKRLRRWL